MTKIVIPDYAHDFLPKNVDPSQLWVRYNPKADSLTVYFTGKPVPSIWSDVDKYAYIGFALDDETTVTGVMIEHFSKWLLVYDAPKDERKPATQAIGERITASWSLKQSMRQRPAFTPTFSQSVRGGKVFLNENYHLIG